MVERRDGPSWLMDDDDDGATGANYRWCAKLFIRRHGFDLADN